MPDNTRQTEILSALQVMLSTRLRRDPSALVGTNLLILPTEGKRAGSVAPDLLVVFGIRDRDRDRRSYKVWEEGKVPDFVLEVASQSTFENDVKHKKDTYERLRVREYCVFDPVGGMHRPRLKLFRLEAGAYKRVRSRWAADGSMAVTSETLGLELRFDGHKLRLWDPVVQAYLLEPEEEHYQRMEDRALLAAVAARAGQAERQVAQADRRADSESQARREADRRADSESQARREADRRADSESQARREADRRADSESQARREADRRADSESQARREADRRADSESQARREIQAELAKLKEQIRRHR